MSTTSDHGTAVTTTEEVPDVASDERATTPRTGNGVFRAFWRWHFYASVLVIPIMAMLALTGLIYLFRWQIDPVMHPGVLTVSVPEHGAPIPLSRQEAAVHAAFPDQTVTAVQQGAENRATFFTVQTGEDSSRNVYVDPFTGKVLGSLGETDLLSNLAVQVHGSIVFGSLRDIELFHDPIVDDTFTVGTAGDRIIELAACWAIVMTLTGYYLFFRGRAARLRRKASAAVGAKLRNQHGVTGAVIGAGILLLVFSGLPWTGLWGSVVQKWASGHSASLWGEDPGATSTLGEKLTEIGSNSAPAPWAEGAAPMPESMPESMPGMDHGTDAAGSSSSGTISIDRVMTAAASDGLPQPYYITYPDEKDGVFSVLADQWHDKSNPAFTNVGKERTAHVDQYSGQVVARYGYSDYTVAAKTVSQGIALHEGRRFGSFNTMASTAFCLAVLFLCISGPLMWWRRRPTGGGVAAPRGKMPWKATPWLIAAGVALAIFFPLFGASLLLVLAFDQLVLTRVPRLARTFNRV